MWRNTLIFPIKQKWCIITLHILIRIDYNVTVFTFFIKKGIPKVFFIISVYRYSMIKGLIIWCNDIHLLTHTLHLLINCHSKNSEVHFISSWKQKVYWNNTANSFWLIFNSKHFALVAKFSVYTHSCSTCITRFLKKVTK